jgi:nucleoprotein TPR
LSEKIEELKIANSNSNYLAEMNAELTAKVEDLTAKLLSQSEEAAKMMEQYKKELSSQTRLANLYKESCDESNSQQKELTNVISELRGMLNEATESYGKLETEFKTHKLQTQQDIEDHEQKIADLQDELKNANQLLMENENKSAEEALQKIYPTAAATSKIIKSGKSLTEIFTLYVNAQDELQSVSKENAHLKLRIEEVLAEAHTNAPIFNKLKTELHGAVETNRELMLQIDKLLKDANDVKEEQRDVMAKYHHIEKDNKILRNERQDLSRQVCVLLKRIEEMQGNFTERVIEQDITADMTANEVSFYC